MRLVVLILVIEEGGVIIELLHVLRRWSVGVLCLSSLLGLVFDCLFPLLLYLTFLPFFQKLLVEILIEEKTISEFIFEGETRSVSLNFSL